MKRLAFLFAFICNIALGQTADDDLIRAIQLGDVEAASKAIKAGASVNKVGQYAYTPLTWAMNMQNTAMMEFLISKGADVEYKNPQGATLLLQPMMMGWCAVAEVLLKHGANPNATDVAQSTPAIYAARGGHSNCLAMLAKYKPNWELKDLSGQTALLAAANTGCAPCIETLAENGADMRATDLQLRQALHIAVSAKHPEALAALLANKADINAQEGYGQQTPLMNAAAEGWLEGCQALIEAGADLSVENGNGETALDMAESIGNEAVVALLKDPKSGNAAVSGALLQEKLRKAIIERRLADLPPLLSQKPDLDAVDALGDTPLLYAIRYAPAPAILLLLKQHGAKPQALSADGGNGFHLLAFRSFDADLDSGLRQTARWLLQEGVSVNKPDNEGNTPLMKASESNNLGYCRWLMANGADASAKNNAGKTALDFAKESKNMELAVFIERPQAYRDDLLWKIQEVYMKTTPKAPRLEERMAFYRTKLAQPFYRQQLAKCHAMLGQYEEAISILKAGNLCGPLALLYAQLHQWPQADSALDCAKNSADSSQYWMEAATIALAKYKGNGTYVEKWLERNGYDTQEASSARHAAYWHAAEYFAQQGEYAKANRLWLSTSTLAALTYGADSEEFLRFQFDYGRMWHALGNPLQAEGHLKVYLGSMAETFGSGHPHYLMALLWLGKVYRAQSNFAAAEWLLQKAANAQTGLRTEAALELAALYTDEGNYELALHLLKEVPAAESSALWATIHIALGKREGVEQRLKEGVNLARKANGQNSPAYHEALLALGRFYLFSNSRDKFGEAGQIFRSTIDYYGKADIEQAKQGMYASWRPNRVRAMGYLAMLLHETGKDEEAAQWYLKAIQSVSIPYENLDRAGWMVDLSRLHLKNAKEAAAAQYYLLQAVGMYELLIEKVFPSLSEHEKAVFFHTIKDDLNFFNYYVFQHREAQPKLIGDMYNHILSTKALVLTSTKRLREQLMESKDPATANLYKQWQQLRDYLANLHASEEDAKRINIDSLEREANRLEKELASKAAGGALFEKRAQWQQVRDRLNSGEAAIEILRISHGDKVHYVALVVTQQTQDYPLLVELPNGNDMEGKWLKYYRSAVEYKLDDDESYERYWKPIKQAMEKLGIPIKKVFFSPDGIYNQMNPKGFLNPADGKYLMDELDFEQVTRTDDLLSMSVGSRIDGHTAVLLGKPDYEQGAPHAGGGERAVVGRSARQIAGLKAQSFSELPGTEAEVNGIERLVETAGWQVRKYLGEQATEMRLKSALANNMPGIVHIATHGFFIGNPMADTLAQPSEVRAYMPLQPHRVVGGLDPMLQSGLILAGVNNPEAGSDGILTAYEAMNLDLSNTALVALSACETGLGEIRNGEGVYGLQRALKVAGAKASVMSLWKVSDEATQMLMQSFYQTWLATGNKRQAFEQAQLALRKHFPEPYYWAAFVMIGQ